MSLKIFFSLLAAVPLLAGCGSSAEGAAAATTSGAGGGSADGGGGGGALLGAGGGASDSGSADCSAAKECGTFGHGCVNCAITSVCAAPYKTCADDPPCVAYAACFNGCNPKDLSCLKVCAQKYPQGVMEYGEVIKCVVCGACFAQCMPAPDQCP